MDSPLAQQQVSDAPTPEYRFARPDVAELASALATMSGLGHSASGPLSGLESSVGRLPSGDGQE
jgi:hypothetical protein